MPTDLETERYRSSVTESLSRIAGLLEQLVKTSAGRGQFDDRPTDATFFGDTSGQSGGRFLEALDRNTQAVQDLREDLRLRAQEVTQ